MNKTPKNSQALASIDPDRAAPGDAESAPNPAGKSKPNPAKQDRPLTPKQAQFIRNIVDNGMNKTDAYINAYDHNGKRKTANENASRTASLQQVKSQLANYSQLAESTLVDVMQYSREYGRDNSKEGASYASVSVATAKFIHEHVHGKATQRIETKTEAVVLNIDLTGVTP